MSDENTKINKYKDYLSYLPIISALLIFLGYLNYDLYYRKLEISIFSYLETSELLFSFIDIVYPIILAAIALHIYFYVLTLNEAKKKIEKSEEKHSELETDLSFKEIFANTKKGFIEIKKRNFKGAFAFMKTVFWGLLFNLIILLIKVFAVLFGLIFVGQVMSFDNTAIELFWFSNSEMMIFASLFWLVIIFLYISNKSIKVNKKIGIEIYALVFLLVMIANLNIYQNILAYNTDNDLNEKNVKFNYNGKLINTEDCKSLIGVTKNYLFLRETSKNENLVFKLSDITDMVFYYDYDLVMKKYYYPSCK